MQELIVIFIVALIVFGPKRLPELGRTLGKGMLELKKAMGGLKDQIDEEMREARQQVDQEVADIKQPFLEQKNQLLDSLGTGTKETEGTQEPGKPGELGEEKQGNG